MSRPPAHRMQTPVAISIIVALYNRADTLQQCLDSITRQSHARRELIVIDAGSTDGSVDILQRNHEQISYWVSEPDRGIYHAWNKGLAKASGDWICFLGADDYLWNDDVLATVAATLQTLPPAMRVCYGKVMLLQENGQALYAIGKPWPEVKHRFRQLMSVPHPGLMHRRSLFEQHGVFDESYRIAGDYELLLRELAQGDAVFLPDVVVCGMRQGGVSSSQANALKTLREARRAQRSHGICGPGWAYMDALGRVYLKLAVQKLFGAAAVGRLVAAVRQSRKSAAD